MNKVHESFLDFIQSAAELQHPKDGSMYNNHYGANPHEEEPELSYKIETRSEVGDSNDLHKLLESNQAICDAILKSDQSLIDPSVEKDLREAFMYLRRAYLAMYQKSHRSSSDITV